MITSIFLWGVSEYIWINILTYDPGGERGREEGDNEKGREESHLITISSYPPNLDIEKRSIIVVYIHGNVRTNK